MRLLILTQKVDVKDSALGFFHNWIKEFSKNFETLEVICLQKGESNLPKNVFVHSLGKEDGNSRQKYLYRFFRYIWQRRKQYDAVFVHMNQEYVLLGGLFWRLQGKRLIFWYNHTQGGILTRIAMLFADRVCHTSPFAFTSGTKKSVKMPAGIDVENFKLNYEVQRNPHKILYVGRIAPAKKVHVLINAVEILNKEGIDFTLNIYGDALDKDQEYLGKLKETSFDIRDKVWPRPIPKVKPWSIRRGNGANFVVDESAPPTHTHTCGFIPAASGRGILRNYNKKVFFHGAVPNIETPKIFNSHLIAVNLTAKGNYDKSVLEAAACGAIPLVSSEAFSGVISPELFFKEDDSRDLAEKIKMIMNMNDAEREKLRKNLRMEVEEKESLEKLSVKISEIFGN